MMNTKTVNLNSLREIVNDLHSHAAPTFTVMSESQASQMTSADPAGHIWTVGEKYYMVEITNKPHE